MTHVWAALAFRLAAAMACAAVAGAAAPEPQPPETMAWRLTPKATYRATENIVHVISYDLNRPLRAMLGKRVDPTTFLERKEVRLQLLSADGRYQRTDVDVRRFGGTHAKSADSRERTTHSTGVVSARGIEPAKVEALGDAGEGALAELPACPIRRGQSWSFSRPILVDIELGRGTMTFTDTLTEIQWHEGRKIALISVAGAGRVEAAPNMQAKGFRTASMSLQGKAEFDLTTGRPGAQHYTARTEWTTRVMLTNIGVVFDDTFDSDPWTVAP